MGHDQTRQWPVHRVIYKGLESSLETAAVINGKSAQPLIRGRWSRVGGVAGYQRGAGWGVTGDKKTRRQS